MATTTMNTAVGQAARRKRVQADLVLLGVAIIWGTAFVAQRLAAGQSGVYLFNGLRFLLAALVLAPLAWSKLLVGTDVEPLGRHNLKWVALAGCILVGGAAFQQAGLKYTTAGNAGFITGLYVVLIPIFLALIWRNRLRPPVWIAALLAVVGLFLLSTGGQIRVNAGDALELAGAVFWAMHVILVSRLVQRLNVLQFAVGQYLVCGTINLLLGLWLEPGMMPQVIAGWWTVAYTGLISVGVGYTLQAIAQRVAPPADAAIILSTEAVFAALSGWIFLGEALSPVQLLGCTVMMVGMLLAQSDVWLSRKAGADQETVLQ